MTREPAPATGSDARPLGGPATPVSPVWTAPVRRTRGGLIALTIIGLVFGSLALLLVFVYLSTFLGASALVLCLLLALVPLTGILLVVRWIDRWEPEPRPALWFAFLWGAGVSIVTALVFDLGVQLALAAVGSSRGGSEAGGSGTGTDAFAAVLQAPLVEEGAKGVGILVLFLVLRRRFDGPVDGIVYAATIAAGFAFSENIQYFGVAMAEGGADGLGFTFLVRGVFSPFAHVTFTACTGIAFGIVSRRRAGGTLGRVLIVLAGFALAVALHGLWNGAAYLLTTDSALLFYYVLVQLPLFIGYIVAVVLLRRQEERITVDRLGEYAAAGWFTPREVSMLATGPGRRQARAWAARQPRERRVAMRLFIADATRLAFARQRMLNGTADRVARADEAELLALVQAHRAIVIG
ncbi:PrsW family intramembrane metalloprotease [Cryobacterium breve]|uniref:PrsW family intramembrane metalloprotease n=1 Tax=Cryobacterium breve TaxID=1259258 RepID=A0ABY7NB55_9MICO|nr:MULTISPECIES: PrsW family intramembrane metalloprotease [Cryobacterium]MDY7543218.1 PrsW family intramembrane metalloprotease [Cryobacterium sp. 5B3]MEA9998382.1 PrsW family intramembrane metalloprotease [Cryobacterium sp. RTS3]MEB0265276.1 PrsW family intramembrane metalloprotease [Cryobacterium sp. 10I5]MEB0274326.1 PrsW family intramembrane metalloprotease [Cryobacterium sp. 5B3]WBM79742.1 PrsW family intramembrane metalloprotease [Cryobacterium breve]